MLGGHLGWLVVAQHPAGHGDLMDFIRAVVNPCCTSIAIHPLQWKIPGNPKSSGNLNRPSNHVEETWGAPEFNNADISQRVLVAALFHFPCVRLVKQTACFQLAFDVG